MILNESHVEEAALGLLEELGYAIGHGPRMAPGEPAEERRSFADVVLPGRLREAIWQLNPSIPMEAREEALHRVLRFDSTSLLGNNRAFHRLLRDGVPVEYRRPDGSIAGDRVQLLNFADPVGNDWLAVNQFTVIEGQHNRRPDIVCGVSDCIFLGYPAFTTRTCVRECMDAAADTSPECRLALERVGLLK